MVIEKNKKSFCELALGVLPVTGATHLSCVIGATCLSRDAVVMSRLKDYTSANIIDYPPVPPPPPEGGWEDPVVEKVENIYEAPKHGYTAPIPDDPVDIRRFHLLVGRITYAMKHPLDPENLMLTYIKMGEPFPRPVVSEIGKFYTKEDLENRKVVALCNLEPLQKKNITNTAMLICANCPDSEGGVKYELLKPPSTSKVGEEILCENYPLMGELIMSPQLPYMPREEKVYERVITDLSINKKKELVYKAKHRLFTKKSKGFITSETLSNCSIKSNIV